MPSSDFNEEQARQMWAAIFLADGMLLEGNHFAAAGLAGLVDPIRAFKSGTAPFQLVFFAK